MAIGSGMCPRNYLSILLCLENCLLCGHGDDKQVSVFTLDHGVQEALYIARTMYHDNYVVHGSMHTYYTGIPKAIQVAQSKFISRMYGMCSLSLRYCVMPTNAGSPCLCLILAIRRTNSPWQWRSAILACPALVNLSIRTGAHGATAALITPIVVLMVVRITQRRAITLVSNPAVEDRYQMMDKATIHLQARLQRSQVAQPSDTVNPSAPVDEAVEIDLADLDGLPLAVLPTSSTSSVPPALSDSSVPSGTSPSAASDASDLFLSSGATKTEDDELPELIDVAFDDNYMEYANPVDVLSVRATDRTDGSGTHIQHKQSDYACSVHCNPYNFPDLLNPDGRTCYFNTSIAEQTNVWFGGYQAIVREMTGYTRARLHDEELSVKLISTLMIGTSGGGTFEVNSTKDAMVAKDEDKVPSADEEEVLDWVGYIEIAGKPVEV
ncbi:hypothetical protein C8Q80DRAFT_1343352 [Daedaleopsis nitida]|nr:hypothetical protein C8Q80DRAFT_1343352 [Daedaleopsis nitida]